MLFALSLIGCQAGDPTSTKTPLTTKVKGAAAQAQTPVALVGGRPIGWQTLRPFVIEAGGGQAFMELVVGRLVDQRLADRGLTLTDQLIDAERTSFLAGLDADADQAQRLMNEVRRRRGLGRHRFPLLLRRNAGLRLLVQDQVRVSEPAIHEAYEFRYGPKYEARIIVIDTLAVADEVIRKAGQGESFIDLAVRYSTDSSRAQGGLLPLVSPVDPTFPQAVRSALAQLQPGQISDPVVLEGNFAVLKLERIVEGSKVASDDVRDELEAAVRRREEQVLMQQLLRTMLREAEVIVMDSDLQQRWDYQRELLMGDAEQ